MSYSVDSESTLYGVCENKNKKGVKERLIGFTSLTKLSFQNILFRKSNIYFQLKYILKNFDFVKYCVPTLTFSQDHKVIQLSRISKMIWSSNLSFYKEQSYLPGTQQASWVRLQRSSV